MYLLKTRVMFSKKKGGKESLKKKKRKDFSIFRNGVLFVK